MHEWCVLYIRDVIDMIGFLTHVADVQLVEHAKSHIIIVPVFPQVSVCAST